MLQVNELDGFGVSGAEGLKLTYLGSVEGGAPNSASHAFNIDCGSRAGLLFAGFTARATSSSSVVSSASVDGIAMELEHQFISGAVKAALFKKEIGATGLVPIVVTLNASASDTVAALHVWLLEGYQSKDRLDMITGTGTSVSGPMAAPAVVGLAAGANNVDFTWTGLTKRFSSSGSRIMSCADGVAIDGTVGASTTNTGRAVLIAGYG